VDEKHKNLLFIDFDQFWQGVSQVRSCDAQYFFNRFLCCFVVETTLALDEIAILYCLFYILHNANLPSEYMFIGYGQKLKHIGFRSLPLFFGFCLGWEHWWKRSFQIYVLEGIFLNHVVFVLTNCVFTFSFLLAKNPFYSLIRENWKPNVFLFQ